MSYEEGRKAIQINVLVPKNVQNKVAKQQGQARVGQNRFHGEPRDVVVLPFSGE